MLPGSLLLLRVLEKGASANCMSFRQFLSSYRIPILLILLMALGIRVFLAVRFPHDAFDETRYTSPAVNMLAGHGFSADIEAPYLPTNHTVPFYPLFIAAVYAIFGPHPLAVRIAQSLVDLITCLLLAFLSFTLAPPALKKPAAIWSLLIYGCLSWFTIHWTRYVLTETLALFFTTLALAFGILALKRGRWWWVGAGSACGLALLTRPDSLLLVLAFVLFLSFQIARRATAANTVNLLLFCLAIPVILAPWIARNYIAFERFQPLASEYGFTRDEYMPTGYLRWIRTWMTDETYFQAFHPAFIPGDSSFDPNTLPNNVFDSSQEREQVLHLFSEYDRLGRITPDMNDKFQTIADDRIKREPFRFFVRLPITRIASVWLTGFAAHNQFNRVFRILFVLPILIGGIVGFAVWSRNQPLGWLLLLVMLTRTVFLGYHYAPETRYIVEAFPAMIAACAVTCAALWRYGNQGWMKKSE
jgi:4-amino-4-deoxy-L-arabinose transferase-like glycosyltransferase